MTHTKGKWTVRVLGSGRVAIVINGKNRFLSNNYGTTDDMGLARLMKAAPELYASLKTLAYATHANQDGEDPFQCIRDARALLAEIDKGE